MLKLAAGIGGIAALALAAPATAGSIQIDSALECSSSIFGFCSTTTSGSGHFTIHNNTTEWRVTGFVVTTDPVSAFPSSLPFTPSTPADTASALTGRPGWSAAAAHIGVDPVTTTTPPILCFPFPGGCDPITFTTFASYAAQFTYTASDNDIGPGESDGSFAWGQAISLPFSLGLNLPSSYEIFLAGIGNDSTAVCTGTLGIPGNPDPLFAGIDGPAISSCDAPSSEVLVGSAPEPGSLALLGAGLLGVALSRRRKRRVA